MDTPGAHLHSEHPFQPPLGERVPVRRVRGRLPSPVTLWTAATGTDRAGLTVSSTLVVEPGLVIGVVGPDSDLAELLGRTERTAVQLLDWRHRQVADVFAFVAPSPGGPFRSGHWTETSWGPVLHPAPTWLGVRVLTARAAGWGLLVEAEVEHTEVEDDPQDALVWHRGQYRHLG